MGGQHVALLQCQAFQRDRLGGLAVAAGKTQQGGVRLPARQIFQNVADAPTAPRGLNGEGVVTAHGQLPRELSTTPKTPRPVKAEALSGRGRGGTNAPARVRPSLRGSAQIWGVLARNARRCDIIVAWLPASISG